MKFYSTNKKAEELSFDRAVLKGLATDQGVYMPKTVPVLPADFFNNIEAKSKEEIGFAVLEPYLRGVFDNATINEIISETINFDFPLVEVEQDVYALELFHGPTLAFKDVGARFLARCLSKCRPASGKVKVLVATSGDTGSAVAQGFLKVAGVEVVILYPKGKISKSQEQQLTTNGNNIEALEVDGDFDDCQRLVKTAFSDLELNEKLFLTSANSINIARLLPQSLYYFFAYQQLRNKSKKVVVSVPSGNYGNLTAGLLAKTMGLPIHHFVASTNANKSVPNYLETGQYEPLPSVATISNAMDVGAPNNFPRMQALLGDWEGMKKNISAFSYSDEQTKAAMLQVKSTRDYVMDPHGAVGYLGLQDYLKNNKDWQGIFLETAHPAKFKDIVDGVIQESIAIPERLQKFLDKEKQVVAMSKNYADFKSYLEA